ncbi:BrnA antitoxin family protein [Pseudomonas sp. UBA4194]|nr:BrnA antitoxin family protein [Pseudomonas sp. UBA4194]
MRGPFTANPADVLEQFRTSAPGRQTRINTALLDWLKPHQP